MGIKRGARTNVVSKPTRFLTNILCALAERIHSLSHDATLTEIVARSDDEMLTDEKCAQAIQ